MRQMHPDSFPSLLSVFLLLLPVFAAQAAPLPAPTRTNVSVAGATVSAAVHTAAGEPVATGTVDFLLPNGQSLGSALVGPDGTATLAPVAVPVGTFTTVTGASALPVAAAYHPTDDSLASSVSPAADLPAATAATPDFSVTGSPTTVTAARGSYGTTTLTVSSAGGYAGAIQLSCTGLPAQVTCAFNPTQQSLTADGTFTTTLQLQTQGPSGKASSSLFPLRGGTTLALAFPGALLLLGFARRRRSWHGTALLGALLVLTAGALTGCSQRYGYLHHPPSVATGTPTGTFPITVVVDGNQGSSVLEHSLAISLVVQ